MERDFSTVSSFHSFSSTSRFCSLCIDLQGLSIASKPIEPILTPTEFEFVNVSNRGKLLLLDTAIAKTPIALEAPQTDYRSTGSVADVTASTLSTRRKPMPWSRKKNHKRKDSFALMMDDGADDMSSTSTKPSGSNNPPSVDELKRIAEDIKNGLY